MLSNILLSFLHQRRLCLSQSQWGCASGTSMARKAYPTGLPWQTDCPKYIHQSTQNITKCKMAKNYFYLERENPNKIKKPHCSKYQFDSSLLMSNFSLECIANNNKQNKNLLHHFRALRGKCFSLKFSNKRMIDISKSFHTNATVSTTYAPSPIILL